MKRKHYLFILLAGLVASMLILTGESVWGHDCYARLMNGDFSTGDCARTVWDQMAPIFAGLAVAVAIAGAAVGGAAIVGIGTAVGGSTLLQGFGYAAAAYGAYSTYQTYQEEGFIGVIKEESGYNDFAEALNPDNSLGEKIGYAGLGFVNFIGLLSGVGQGWKGLKQGLKQGWKDLSEGLKDLRKGGKVADWLRGGPQEGFTLTMAGPPSGGFPGGRPRGTPPKASRKPSTSKTPPKTSPETSAPKTPATPSREPPSRPRGGDVSLDTPPREAGGNNALENYPHEDSYKAHALRRMKERNFEQWDVETIIDKGNYKDVPAKNPEYDGQMLREYFDEQGNMVIRDKKSGDIISVQGGNDDYSFKGEKSGDVWN